MTLENKVACVIAGVVLSMGVPIAFKLAGHPPTFLRDLGYRSGPRGTRGGWSLALILALAYIGFTISMSPAVAHHWRDLTLLKALSICASIVAGVVEEGIFRRWLMDSMMKIGAKAWLQIAVSGLAFGVAHGTWGLLGGHVQAVIGATIATTLLGVGLATVYIVGGRSLAPCIAAHFLIDAILEPGLLIGAMS